MKTIKLQVRSEHLPTLLRMVEGIAVSVEAQREIPDLVFLLRSVAEAFGVQDEAMASPSRRREHVEARDAFSYLAYHRLGKTVDSIAEALSRNHSTIVAALVRVERERLDQRHFAERIKTIEEVM